MEAMYLYRHKNQDFITHNSLQLKQKKIHEIEKTCQEKVTHVEMKCFYKRLAKDKFKKAMHLGFHSKENQECLPHNEIRQQ